MANQVTEEKTPEKMISYLSSKLPKFQEDLESIYTEHIPRLFQEITRRENELQEAKFEIEQLKTQLNGAKFETTKMAENQKQLQQNFSTQTKYIEYMGATIGSLLYKSFKVPETVNIINKTENFDDFLYLSEQTLTPFFNLLIENEEKVTPETNLYKFASNLIGSVTNFVAHSDGLLHFFVMENCLNFVNLVFDGFALKSLGKMLKKTILVFIFNISLHEKGMAAIHAHKTVIQNVVDSLKENEMKIVALRVIEALLNFEVTEEVFLILMKKLSKKDLEEIARTAERSDIEDSALNILKQIDVLSGQANLMETDESQES